MQPSDTEIENRLRDILSSAPFQSHADSAWLTSLKDALTKVALWLAGLNFGVRVGIAIVCLMVLGFLLVRLLNLLPETRRLVGTRSAREVSQIETYLTPEQWLHRAVWLAENNRRREAARALQQAVILRQCLMRHVRWRDSTADGEWLQLLHAGAEVENFTHAAQRMAFGPPSTRAEFDACMQAAQALVRG